MVITDKNLKNVNHQGEGFKAIDLILLLGLLLFLAFLFSEPLFNDRVMLSIDSRMGPPYAGYAPDHVRVARSDNIHSDLPFWMMPERLVSIRMMDQNTPPLWTPYTLGGMPLLGGLAYPVYYPVNLLLNSVMGVDPLKALALQTIINLFMAGLGFYLFLKRLKLHPMACFFGAISLSASAWFITHAYIPTFINAAAWVPLIFWAADKMIFGKAFGWATLLMGVFVGFSFLGGFPQTTICGLYGAFIWILLRMLFSKSRGFKQIIASISGYALAAAAGLGLSLIQLLPAAEFKTQSLRDQDYPLSYYHQDTLQLPLFMEQAAPGFFGHPVDPRGGGGLQGASENFLPYRLFLNYSVQNNFMENALYIGVLPLLLACFALFGGPWRINLILILLSAFALLIACGSPLLDFAYGFLPGLKVGGPKRILMLYSIALAALGAIGLDGVFRKKPNGISVCFLGALGVLGVLCLTAFFSPLSGMVTRWWTGLGAGAEETPEVLAYLKGVLWLPVAGICFFSLALFLRVRVHKGLACGLMVLFTLGELVYFSFGFITTQEAQGQYPETEAVTFLKEQEKESGPFRVAAFGVDSLLIPNLTAVHGVQNLGGVSGLIHRRYGEYCQMLDPLLINMEDPRYISALQSPESLLSPMLDLLGVRYVAASRPQDAPLFEKAGFPMRFIQEKKDAMAFFENPGALPKAFAVVHWRKANNKKEAAELVGSKDFQPKKTVILEEDPPQDFSCGPDPEGKVPEVKITSYAPNRVEIEAEMFGAKGLIVLTDNYYPGWKAYVDDAETPILLANYSFRAIPVTEGSHSISFIYEPKTRVLGVWASLVSLGALTLYGGWLFFSGKKDSRTNPEPV